MLVACFLRGRVKDLLAPLQSVFKEPTNAPEFMNVMLLRSNNLHISSTHVRIFRVIRTRSQIQLECVEIALKLKIIKHLVRIQCYNSKIPTEVLTTPKDRLKK